MTNDEGDGLICAYLLDGRGGGTVMDWTQIDGWQPSDGVLWVHLNRTGEESAKWLRDRAGIAPSICETLLTEESRPRVTRLGDALLVILRGANFNPGADPEDMVGVRLWLDGSKIITVRFRRLMAVNDVREELEAGHGPSGPGDFLVRVTDRLTDRVTPVVHEIEDRVDELEDLVVSAHTATLRSKLAQVRQASIATCTRSRTGRPVWSRT
jgi:zinc transporter